MAKLKKFRVYAAAIGHSGAAFYKPAETFGYVEAESAMRALDLVGERIRVRHIPRKLSIAVLGVGSIHVEEVPA